MHKTQWYAFVLIMGLLALPAAAKSIGEVVPYFLKPGETYTATQVSAGGATYSVVLINGDESLVFDADANLITDSATINAVASAYLPKTRNVSIDRTKLKSLNDTFAATKSKFLLDKEESMLTGPRWLSCMTNRKCGVAYDECCNDKALNGAAPSAVMNLTTMFDNAAKLLRDVNDGVQSTEDAASRSDAAALTSASASLLSSVDALASQMNAMKPEITRFGGNFGTVFNMSTRTTQQDIDAVTNAATAFKNHLTSVLPKQGDFDSLASRIAQKTSQRQEVGVIKQRIAEAQAQVPALKRKGGDALAAIKLEIKPLKAALDNLDFSLSEANKSLMANEFAKALNQTSEFNRSAELVENLSAYYAQVAPVWVSVSAALDDAAKQVDAAAIKIGQNEQRVKKLKADFAALKTNVTRLESDLKDGKIVATVQLSSAEAAVKSTAQYARELKPIEAQIDMALIAGIIVALAAVLGLVYYLIRIKKREGGGSASTYSPPQSPYKEGPASPQPPWKS